MIIASLAFLALAAAQVGGGAPQQPQQPEENVKPEDRCTVEGQVLNLATGEPLKKAHVSLGPSGKYNGISWGAVTDAAGKFVIEEVNPGKYRLTADRNGFVRNAYGAKTPEQPGTEITLDKGQKLPGIVFKLVPQGVISGKVVDEDGEPLGGARILVMSPTYQNGRKTLGIRENVNTDDRGEYRAFGLAPGRYYICVTYDRGGQMMQRVEIRKEGADNGYASTFFPNSTSSAQASPVMVTPGGEATGIDFRLTPVHTAHVAGKITNPGPGRFTMLFMLARDSGMAWGTMKQAMTDEKGAFLFRNVTPGSYTISAHDQMAGGEPRQAQVVVDVGDSNVDGVQLTFGTGQEIGGVVKGLEAKGRGMNVYLAPDSGAAMMQTPSGQVQDDGTFKLKVLMPDRYRVGVYPPPEGYYIKSIRAGDTDYPSGVIDWSKGVMAGDLTITLADDGAQIEGKVQDAKDQPATSASVVLVPDQRDYRSYYAMANTDQNGHFTIKGIKPGKYKLFAWDAVQYGQYEDPDFIRPFEEKGETVELKAGDKSSKDLKLIVTGDVADSGDQ